MSANSINIQTEKSKQPKIRNKGIIRASYIPTMIAVPTSVTSIKLLNAMKKLSSISKDDSIELSKAVQKGLHETGLYDKGVRVYKIKENPTLSEFMKKIKELVKKFITKKIDENSISEAETSVKNLIKYDRKDFKALNAINEEIRSNKRIAKYGKEGSKKISGIIAKFQALMFKEGNNACYLPHANKIITPDKSLQTSVFHEMGHALNNNGGMLLKALQKARPLAKIAPPIILLVALLNKRKTTDKPKENDSKLQKGADFVKKNAGILTGLSFMPMILEEGIASLRGQKIAKNLTKTGELSKELFKKVKQTNLCGFTSYALAGIIGYISVKLAVKVKDKIQANYENKKLIKFNKINGKPKEIKVHQG